MGLIGKLKQALSPSLESRLKTEATDKVNKLRELVRSGASKDTINELFEDISRSTEFNQVLGNLSIWAPIATAFGFSTSPEPDSDAYKTAWDKYSKAQQECDDFFGLSFMRSWTIARSLKAKFPAADWDFVDQLLIEDEYWASEFRTHAWRLVPWSFAIKDEVEERHGAGSCNKELFHSTWRELTDNDTVMAFINTLDDEDIAYYRCVD